MEREREIERGGEREIQTERETDRSIEMTVTQLFKQKPANTFQNIKRT